MLSNSFIGESFKGARALMFGNIEVLALIQCCYILDSCLGALGAESSGCIFLPRRPLHASVSLFWSKSKNQK